MKFSTGARKKENTLRIGSRVCSGASPGGIAPAPFLVCFTYFPETRVYTPSQKKSSPGVKGGQFEALRSAWMCTGKRSSR